MPPTSGSTPRERPAAAAVSACRSADSGSGRAAVAAAAGARRGRSVPCATPRAGRPHPSMRRPRPAVLP
ncbi:hypothetical protein SB717_38425, partial [Priestia sp. SIMBA_032]|uniref:hypothetical protein n=1 Tax=Priestia sp. SIMBA_032 TaxID=3085775 RepID=UPI00397B7E43